MTTHVSRTQRSRSTETRRGADRRNQIVSASAALFDEVGYHLTSMDDIARAVGLAKPSLYHYFPSKDSILLAIHEEFMGLILGRLQDRLSRFDGSVEDQLLDVMVDICDLMRTHRGYVRVFFEHNRELPERERKDAVAKRDEYFATVQGLFVRGHEEGRLNGDPWLSAMALFGMCNWVYQWYDPNGRLTPLDVARYFHRLLLRGLEPHGS
jgi:AcrR family transcriptional regulator